MNTPIDRSRSIGLASGALWLGTAGAAFVMWALVAIATPTANAALIASLVITAALIVTSVVVIRATLHLPGAGAPLTPERRTLRRRFAWVFVAELAAFAIVNPIAAATGHTELLPSLNVMIVGLHFLPLAWIFRVPRYYIMGLLFCGIPTVMLLSMSEHARIGHALGWFVIPGLGCGLVAALTAVAGLRESWRSVISLRPVPQH